MKVKTFRATATKFEWLSPDSPRVWFSVEGMNFDSIPVSVTQEEMKEIVKGNYYANIKLNVYIDQGNTWNSENDQKLLANKSKQ